MTGTFITTSDIPDQRNPNGYYTIPRKCFFCDEQFEGRNEFWEHVADEHPESNTAREMRA